MLNPRLFLLAAPLCVSISNPCPAVAQTGPEFAKLKPADFLARAATENGLGSLTTPWHVLVRFETFEPAGIHKNSGTFEEWWFGPRSYKSVYRSELLNQTDVATEEGLFRAGDQPWPSSEDLARAVVMSPLAIDAPNLKESELLSQTAGSGATEMRCISTYRSHRPDEHIGNNMPRDLSALPSACFANNSVILRSRSTGPGGPVLILNKIVRFEGNYVAAEASIVVEGKPLLTAEVLQLNSLPEGTARPEPVAGSQGPLHGPIEPPGDTVHVASGESDYMESVIRAIPVNQTTEVKLRITLDEEGRVQDVQVVSGPPQFAEVVAKATFKLRFEPITLLGTPVKATLIRTETFRNSSGGLSIIHRR